MWNPLWRSLYFPKVMSGENSFFHEFLYYLTPIVISFFFLITPMKHLDFSHLYRLLSYWRHQEDNLVSWKTGKGKLTKREQNLVSFKKNSFLLGIIHEKLNLRKFWNHLQNYKSVLPIWNWILWYHSGNTDVWWCLNMLDFHLIKNTRKWKKWYALWSSPRLWWPISDCIMTGNSQPVFVPIWAGVTALLHHTSTENSVSPFTSVS